MLGIERTDSLTATSCAAMEEGTPLMLSTLALSASSRPPSLGREGSPARRLRSMSDHAMTGGINAG